MEAVNRTETEKKEEKKTFHISLNLFTQFDREISKKKEKKVIIQNRKKIVCVYPGRLS